MFGYFSITHCFLFADDQAFPFRNVNIEAFLFTFVPIMSEECCVTCVMDVIETLHSNNYAGDASQFSEEVFSVYTEKIQTANANLV